MKLNSGIGPEVGGFVEELLKLDFRRVVANLLAGEQHLQGGEEDPARDGPGRTIDLKDLKLLDDVVKKVQGSFRHLEGKSEHFFESLVKTKKLTLNDLMIWQL